MPVPGPAARQALLQTGVRIISTFLNFSIADPSSRVLFRSAASPAAEHAPQCAAHTAPIAQISIYFNCVKRINC
jgi:hypothetical protein